MAAQDLIISRRNPAAPGNFLDADSADGPAGADGAAVLLATLRKRWLLLAIILVVGGGVAALAAWKFARESVVVRTAIIYTGLPTAAHSPFDPLGAATGAEMITSVNVVERLCARRGIDIPPSVMADLITTNVGRSSSLINVSLAWNNVEDGISTLNDLTEVFIEEMASQRKTILQQHLQHLELSLMHAKGRVDEARSQLEALKAEQRKQLDKGGLASDQYRSVLNSIVTSNAAIDEKRTQQLGVKEMIDRVTSQIDGYVKTEKELQGNLKKDYLHEAGSSLTKALQGYAVSAVGARQINQTIAAISELNKPPAASQPFDEWHKKLVDILQGNSNGLSENEKKKLDEAFAKISRENDNELRDIVNQRRHLEGQHEKYLLELIPIKNQIVMFEQRRDAYKKEAAELGEKITGISTMQLDESEHNFAESEKQEDSITVQRDSLRQLSETRHREWKVTVPASLATATVASNRTKLFILVFGLSCFALSAPLFVAEWHTQSGSPQVQMARSLRVPVLAERILEHFLPQQRASAAGLQPDEAEMLRMLTLRIQQSCHRTGSVVLFSSLDTGFSAAPLMATVAECLAEREERVLLIDAVCPQRSLFPVLNLMSPQQAAAQSDNGNHARAAQPVTIRETQPVGAQGLSEYLSEECEAVGELIRPTGCPGVDLIASGRGRFPREAMASSCLTELLNTCRTNYTMVLVHGPAVDCAADLQMLIARADGIVLAATKASGKDPRAREFVEDLLDLGAPLIGLVA